ncbi:phenazine biosynthesis PhzC/PhzF protein [Saitoella complicata NRRL Y-17804]|uniref:phenazine biosynthesis PhzC/PhzF protein n=1 Tax=Saitoella complicata (strain BCRC 22490 / CBS 7301 / JCM 7358 / NBRC 10748 / NRRL Y-17804) TaxID=698492 RepID=UPI000867DCA8|nr:phenazine biosynthesis PhzC/PhzF protein [Saitoella complicata NRRL Y-17804]ODQ49942.1 phenazine biosynthesis PhzC/PhzF protein [Saitoella complicata NRRL Y-17804]
MVSLDYQIIDAFTSKPFAGNPAAVIVLDTDEYPEDSFLLNIAREFNLSETAFLIPFHTSGNDFFHLRWFTPTTEVDLCGHATLASAHVLFSTRNEDSSSLTFHTKSGALIATKRGDLIELDFPEELVGAKPFSSLEEQAHLEGVLEVALPDTKILNIARNRVDYLIEIDSTAHGLQSLPVDISALKHFQARGVIITTAARVPGLDFHSRGFFPLSGVDEDPVTGSAHCMLGPYWIDKLGKRVVRATQGGPRTGEIEVEWDPVKKRVYLRGSAVMVAKGSIMKPTVHLPGDAHSDSRTP